MAIIIFMLISLGLVVLAVWVVIRGEKVKKLPKPRKPTVGDLMFYLLTSWALGLIIGIPVAAYVYNKNHVKDGQWWGWWTPKTS